MTKPKTTKAPYDQFGLRWLDDPFGVKISYPRLERVPNYKENRSDKARRKIENSWEQTFSFGRFPVTPTLLLGYECSRGYLDHVRHLPIGDDKPTGLRWRRIQHQYGGVMCQQKYMVCAKLTPTPEFYTHLTEVVRVPGSGQNLDQAVEYNRIVSRFHKRANKTLKLSCTDSFRDFDEALYPIEVSGLLENLCDLVTDKVPTTVEGWEAMVERRTKSDCKPHFLADLWRSPSHLHLWAVTENSD